MTHLTRYTLLVYTPSGALVRQQDIESEIAMSLRVTYLVDEGYMVDVVPRYWHEQSGQYVTVPGTEWSTER